MKLAKWLGIAAVTLAGALAGLYVAMAERVEVVVVHTHDADGEHATRVWVVDDGGFAWLRTGSDNGTWLPRLRASAAVELARGGETRSYTAVTLEDDATVGRVSQLFLEKYGWSEDLLRAMTASDARQVAIRLDPR